MARATKNYRIRRGEIWERLIVPKDRRTRRKRVPSQAAATILIGDVKYVIPTSISSEGGVLLSLTPANTMWLDAGEYRWDMALTVSRSALLTSTPLTETLAVSGVITVEDNGNLTPMASDSLSESLEQVV